MSYFEFDQPIEYTSAGTALAIRILSTTAKRFKMQSNAPLSTFGSGLRYSNAGDGQFVNNNASRWTVFGSLNENIGLEITDLSFDAGTDSLSFSWSAVPDQTYFIFASPDLLNWQEIDDREATSTLETYTVDVDPEVRMFYRVQDFAN